MLKKILALVLSLVMLFTMVGTIGVSAAADQTFSFDTAYTMMQDMAEHLAGLDSHIKRDFLYDWVHSYMSTDLGVEALITLVDDQTEVGSNQVILDYIASFGTSEAAKSNLKFALALSKCIPTASRADAFSDMKARNEYDYTGLSAEQQAAITRVYEAFLSADHRAMLENMEHLAQTGKDSKKVIMQFLSNFNTTFVITDDINTPADFALYYLHDGFKAKLEDGELKSEYPIVNGDDWATAEELIGKFIDSANDSAYFDTGKKADFKTVWGISGIDMYIPREFSMTQTGNLEQVEGETTAVNFTASSNITTDDLSQVKWFVDGTEVATGATFAYDTPSAIGSYVVKAQLGAYETTPVTVSVVSAPSYTLNISSSGNLSQDENVETPVVFTPVATPDIADLTQTVWYVNGTATYTGASFSYTPDGPGIYEVHAVLGGAVSEETITITVTPAGYGPVTITSTGSLSQTSGSTSAVTFTAVPDDGVTDVSGAKWFINGADQHVTGDTFTFTPSAIGSYIVKVQMPDGSYSTNTITVSVTGVVGPGPVTGGGSYYPTEKEPDYGDITKPIIAPVVTGKVTQFEDVEGHWAEPYMEALYELGIFAGTSDTTMNPDWGITRQEVAVLLVRMLGLTNEVPQQESYYTDWEDVASWAKTSVGVLSDRGIYVGYGDGSFQPERIISRQELISVIGRQLSGEYEIILDYVDTHEIYYWAVEHVEELTAFGIVQGYPDDTFRPIEDITRAEAAVIFYNTMYRLGKIRVVL